MHHCNQPWKFGSKLKSRRDFRSFCACDLTGCCLIWCDLHLNFYMELAKLKPEEQDLPWLVLKMLILPCLVTLNWIIVRKIINQTFNSKLIWYRSILELQNISIFIYICSNISLMFFFFPWVTTPSCFSAQCWLLCQAVPAQPLFSVLPVSSVSSLVTSAGACFVPTENLPSSGRGKFALPSRSCSAPAFVGTCPLNPRDIKGFPHVMEAPWPALKWNNGSPIFWDLCSKCVCLPG